MANVDITELMDFVEEHMMKTEDSLKNNFAAIRTGKASPSLVENITVDYYGTYYNFAITEEIHENGWCAISLKLQ